MILFNKPFIGVKELDNISDVFRRAKLSGNGYYTQEVQYFFNKRYGIGNPLMTTSCTDALEMAALLMNINSNDEVILPSFTFVSTANAFALRGAKLVFADSNCLNPNIDVEQIEFLITLKTKAIIVVHYAGVAVDMDKISELAQKYNLYVVEDAAQAIDAFYKDKALGTFGDFSTFSFHETKNIIAGEAGLLGVNNELFREQSEIIWEKGTNRSAFFRGEVDKYNWVNLGSSFLPSEIISAFLMGQIQILDEIQKKRKLIWLRYDVAFKENSLNSKVGLPYLPDYSSNNAHMYYLILNDIKERSEFISFMKTKDIQVVYHYLSLHKSPYFSNKHDGRNLINSDKYTDCLVRLPLFYEMTEIEQKKVIDNVLYFFNK